MWYLKIYRDASVGKSCLGDSKIEIKIVWMIENLLLYVFIYFQTRQTLDKTVVQKLEFQAFELINQIMALLFKTVVKYAGCS